MTNCHRMETQNLVISFDYIWFLAKNLAYAECRIMKFQYRNSSKYQVHGLSLLNCTRIESSFVTLAYQSLSHLELEEEDLISFNTKLDTTRPSSISRYEIILIIVILSWQCKKWWLNLTRYFDCSPIAKKYVKSCPWEMKQPLPIIL